MAMRRQVEEANSAAGRQHSTAAAGHESRFELLQQCHTLQVEHIHSSSPHFYRRVPAHPLCTQQHAAPSKAT